VSTFQLGVTTAEQARIRKVAPLVSAPAAGTPGVPTIESLAESEEPTPV
jgi:hypothetical protein